MYTDIIHEIMNNELVKALISAALGAISKEILNTLKRKLKNIKLKALIARLTGNKIIKVVFFILLYVLPIAAISLMVISDTAKNNTYIFMLFCVILVYNILQSHINSIWGYLHDLTVKSSANDTVHREAINSLFEKTGMEKRIKSKD